MAWAPAVSGSRPGSPAWATGWRRSTSTATAYVLREHLDELAGTQPTTAVRLLPGCDQWVLGPGTDDPHVIAANRRSDVSRQSGWIAPIVVVGGVVAGTWELDGEVVRVAWFGEAGAPRRADLAKEVKRLATIFDRSLRLELADAP